jgi:hypothetical protein
MLALQGADLTLSQRQESEYTLARVSGKTRTVKNGLQILAVEAGTRIERPAARPAVRPAFSEA